MTEETENPDAILARYLNAPAALKNALAQLTEAQLDIARTPDTWTIRQIVHHIVDGDDIWKVCLKAALGNSQAIFGFQWYWDKPQSEWVKSWNYAGRTIEPSLALFAANRSHVEQLIKQIHNAWERYITLRTPKNEEIRITVGDIIESQARHAMNHISEILEIRQTYGI